MPFRRRALSLLALASVFGASACQPAAPAAPSAPTTTIAVDSTPEPQPPLSTAPPAASQANPAAQPANQANPVAQPTANQANPAAAPTAAPKPSPTTLPTMPITTLASLPADQARAVRDARNALPAGDYTRAIGLVEPLVEQLKGDQQAEVRLIYGQALVGDRQFEKALATGETLLQSTTRADLVSAALEATACTAEGELMGLRHRQFPMFGVQFHPESILTTMGKQLLANFLAV